MAEVVLDLLELIDGVAQLRLAAWCWVPTHSVERRQLLHRIEECRTHETDLNFVDPTILATQVVQVDEENGFTLAPQRVSRLMRKPLVAAVDGQHKSLSLRVRSSH